MRMRLCEIMHVQWRGCELFETASYLILQRLHASFSFSFYLSDLLFWSSSSLGQVHEKTTFQDN